MKKLLDGHNVVIRPLYYCREADLARWAELRNYPIIPCNLCGSQANQQRQVIKQLLKGWDEETPGRVDSIARSLRHIVPSHLGDVDQFDFASLSTTPAELFLRDVMVE